MKKIIIQVIAASFFLGSNILSADKIQTTRNPAVRAAATEHNKNTVLLMQLPGDVHNHILANYVINPARSISYSIKDALSLSATCTHCDKMLPYFGKLLQSYDFNSRQKTMKKVLNKSNDLTYWNNRRTMLLLAHAGHNSISRSFVCKSDHEILKTLFENGADPNKFSKFFKKPMIFFAKNSAIGQLFIEHGANLQLRQQDGFLKHSILEHLATDIRIQIKLIKFYIRNGCDPRQIDDEGNCLLHKTALSSLVGEKKAIFFLTLIPDMINTSNNAGNTPLDYLNRDLEFRKKTLVPLFRQYGAKTAQELAEEKAASELIPKQVPAVAAPAPALEQIVDNNEAAGCLICYEEESKEIILTSIPCKNPHADQICTICLKTLLKCPLCSNPFTDNK